MNLHYNGSLRQQSRGIFTNANTSITFTCQQSRGILPMLTLVFIVYFYISSMEQKRKGIQIP